MASAYHRVLEFRQRWCPSSAFLSAEYPCSDDLLRRLRAEDSADGENHRRQAGRNPDNFAGRRLPGRRGIYQHFQKSNRDCRAIPPWPVRLGAQGEIQPSFWQAIPSARKAERKKQAQTAASGEQAVPHSQPPFPRHWKIARQSRRSFQNECSVGYIYYWWYVTLLGFKRHCLCALWGA